MDHSARLPEKLCVVCLDEVTAFIGKPPRLQHQDPWQLGCLDCPSNRRRAFFPFEIEVN